MSKFTKILGWATAGILTTAQLMQNGTPHGTIGWLQFAGNLMLGATMHGAANSNGNN